MRGVVESTIPLLTRVTQVLLRICAILACSHDTLRYSGYAERVSTSSLYECCTGFFHAGSSGTVLFGHVVCCTVVAVVRLMMGLGLRKV